MERVVVGLSGGVDSSVAAHLLKEQGYDVIAVFMKNWHDTSVTISDDCPWEEDSKDALLVAERLGIPFHTIDLSEEYHKRIIDYMFSEYEAGRTPNPDILCNREIKFDIFLKHALKLGADYVATGHYCRKESIDIDGSTIYRLLAGKDPDKDQSYFLCQIDQEQLSRALFPIGGFLKSEVRKLARSQNLITAEKRDSQGLCFIGKVKLPDFLRQKLKEREGKVVEISKDWTGFSDNLADTKFYSFKEDDGEAIGLHSGAHYYTIGQRKGLNIGGYTDPLFIIQTNTETNTVYVGEGEQHPGLMRKGLEMLNEDVHWVRPDYRLKPGERKTFQVRIRYRQSLFAASIENAGEISKLHFDEPQKAVAPGQFAAWYDGDELIGSGIIR
jgi:tRNA-specific 2-thiouridylase